MLKKLDSTAELDLATFVGMTDKRVFSLTPLKGIPILQFIFKRQKGS
jgi:hypothetical protein